MSRRINYTAMEDDSGVLVDDDESRIVTEFLFNTCRMLQPTAHHVHAAMFSSLPSQKTYIEKALGQRYKNNERWFNVGPMSLCVIMFTGAISTFRQPFTTN